MSSVTSRLRVAPVEDEATARAVRALHVADDQYRYVGDIGFNLADSLRDPMSEAMAIWSDDRVVGFYRLDFAPNAVVGHALGTPSVGLRSFVIDHDHQGQGLGRRAVEACCADLRQRHPERSVLALTVNCENHAAIAAYTKAGFRDTGERHNGGSAGPQHLMLHSL